MQSKYKRLGDYIRQCDERNRDLSVSLLRGVSTAKKLIESKANTTGVNFSGYKVVSKGQFVYVPDTSRRGDKIALAMNEGEPCIVSSIYTVFEIKENAPLLPEFLFLWFKRSEFDRYARFNSWGSARETFDWDDMCNVMMPIPSIEEQKKYVLLYNGLLKNQRCYGNSLNDLQLICDSYLEDLKGKIPPSPLGSYIQPCDERNRNLSVTLLRGVSTAKELIESKANTTGVNFSSYKIVRKGQFVYVPDTSRRGDKIALAINEGDSCIVSSIYTVFEVREDSPLLPEFLFLWFKRSEFDRYARYNSWGSARETFDWDEMCRVEVPIPDIEVQRSIVAIHHTLETRKRLNEELKANIVGLCPILMRGVVEMLSANENDQVLESAL